VYDEGESDPICCTVIITSFLSPPVNLEASVTGNDVHLTWEPPGSGTGEWIHWDDGVNYTSVGLVSGHTFFVASRWDQASLSSYDGQYLTKVSLYPVDPATGYILKVWTGANAGTLVLDQTLTGLTFEDWNEIVLDSPVQIDASTELWFGYKISNHPYGAYPAGADAGPAIAGYGDMISMNGTTWEPMSGLGLDYNWNLQGWVQSSTNGKSVAKPITNTTVYENTGTLSKGPISLSPNTIFSPNKALLGYNVYRDGSQINTSLVTDLFYDDLGLSGGVYEYYVTALYDEGESGPSNTVTVDVITNIKDYNIDNTVVYPNPATSIINIKSDNNISEIKIINYIGQKVYYENMNEKIVQINTSKLKSGIYLIHIETNKGLIIKRIAIE
ncbi:MAG: T9SS type A sorting domain-containing protein, partial [Bacteroidales bacterium]|nr:T9SS type A sorting domain-containing protein [Bacteroidales bacterium]